MAHTFLLREGIWVATGSCTDGTGRSVPVEGQSEVTHGAAVWVVDGVMRLLGPAPVEIRNRYEVAPIPPGGDSTTWTSSNPAIGTLRGRFVVVADVIFSTYETDGGEWSGVECLIQLRDTRYLARGFLLRGGAAVSSWAVELRRSRP
jgi:hypothetical protein